ncbi:MAG: M48 family metalloprotease [Polyangiaceae bacterium]
MLEPLSYHRALRDHLVENAPRLWGQLAADAFQDAHVEVVELELLKSTLRLSRESYPTLHASAQRAAEALDLDLPLELYQSTDERELNATLFFAPGVLRVVFSGPITERLEPSELDALLGHELAHYVFWTTERGDFFTAQRVLEALSLGSAASANSLRLFQLATEIYADRAGLLVTGELEHTLNTLIKVSTGLVETDPEALLVQADQVLALDSSGSQRATHPELYMRAKAAALFHGKHPDADALVSAMVEGRLELDALDLLGRPRVERLTRELLDLVLQPMWCRTDTVMAHARSMFDDYEGVSAAPDVEALRSSIHGYGPTVQDYFGYLLTDLVAVDPELEQVGLAHALVLSDQLGLRERVEKFVNKELKITKKALKGVWADRERLLESAGAHGE